jgi:long-chain acyl-CoA synthetase
MTVSAQSLSTIKAPRSIDPDLPRYVSLVHMFRSAVEQHPDTEAVVWEDRSITYAGFGRAVEGLRRELEPLDVRGGRVVIMMPNTIEMDVALMAGMAAGAQVAPVNPFFTTKEHEKVLSGVDARVILCDQGSRAKADAAAEAAGADTVVTLGPGGTTIDQWVGDDALVFAPEQMPDADDLALLIFTGGSTGIPKGVDHTHRGLIWSFLQHCTVWPVELGRETFLNVAPMFHIWGLAYATWVPIYAQSTLVMVPRYDPDKVVTALSQHRVTVFGGGPAPIYMGLLASPLFDGADLSALKYCLSGGAACPEDLHREWLERTGCPLFEGWGMSEGAPLCLNPADGKRKLLSVGNPVPETFVEVVDLEEGTTLLPRGEAGEVRVTGPQIMRGYRNNPDETALALRDGWVYTGDIGYLDDEGFLFLVDRKKDLIIVGGYNVYPRDVDEILFNHPKIREAATVGKRDSRLGEVVAAFVVLDAGETMTEQEFFDYCSKAMVKYKRPVEVHFIDALPRTGTNKINRIALRDRLRGR